jgi:CRISPR-associated endonuclease/helicase Cas3
VLCIVGTRAHARDLFVALREKEPVGTFHLSALMCPAHRSAKLAEIKAALNQEGAPCRVVATTVVEAGVDIDFPLVYRIMAGLDSIAQAAGRCNREGRLDPEQAIVQLFEIEGWKWNSIPELHVNEDTARGVLRRHASDPLSLEAIEAYFQELYRKKEDARVDGLDASPHWPDNKRDSILQRLNAQTANFSEGDFWLPFADVARAFRMIDTAMEPVIIPWDDNARDLIAQLEDPKLERPGPIARKLQPYIVNVPRGAFAELRRIGRVVPIHEYRFKDQFMRLSDEAREELYKHDLGFDWSDPTFRKVESGIV